MNPDYSLPNWTSSRGTLKDRKVSTYEWREVGEQATIYKKARYLGIHTAKSVLAIGRITKDRGGVGGSVGYAKAQSDLTAQRHELLGDLRSKSRMSDSR